MAKNTPSMAKNQIKRCLNSILDPLPSERDISQLWIFFEASCAYCGLKLIRSERNGHLDHIVSQAAGGTNDIHNHVLACARCNGDEKREEDWESFLERKVESSITRSERRKRIQDWKQQAPTNRLTLSSQERQALNEITARALQSFEQAVQEVRTLRTTQRNSD